MAKSLTDRVKRYFYKNRADWTDHRVACEALKKYGDAKTIFDEIIDLNQQGVLNDKGGYEQVRPNERNRLYLYRLSEASIKDFKDKNRHRVIVWITIAVAIPAFIAIFSIPKSCSSSNKPAPGDSTQAVKTIPVDTIKPVPVKPDSIKTDTTKTKVLSDTTKGI